MNRKYSMEGKSTEEKLDYLASLSYDVVLRQSGGKYFAIIAELALVSAGESPDKAYGDVIERKSRYFADIIAAEADDEIIYPTKAKSGREPQGQFRLFVYKMLIVCSLFIVGVTASGVFLSNKIAAIKPGTLAKEAAINVINEMYGLAKTPEGIKNDRIKHLHEMVEAIKPFADELKPLIYPECRGIEFSVKKTDATAPGRTK